MKYYFFCIIGLLISACSVNVSEQPIKSFEDCEAQGYTIEPGPPIRCIVNENTVFIKQSQQSSSMLSVTQSSVQSMPSSASTISDEVDQVSSFDPLAVKNASELPTSVQLKVPFTPQAPYANWDPPFDEACEEASLLMVQRFIEGKSLSLAQANAEIIAMTQWQENNGFAIDVSTDELATIANEYYGYKAKTYKGEEVTIENIETLLANGYPVIIPAAGKLLGNPYFSGAGPPYHMLVITGYDANNFYTNDPGTKRGEDFAYSKSIIMNSIHDWNGSVDTIESGPKSIMVVSK